MNGNYSATSFIDTGALSGSREQSIVETRKTVSKVYEPRNSWSDRRPNTRPRSILFLNLRQARYELFQIQPRVRSKKPRFRYTHTDGRARSHAESRIVPFLVRGFTRGNEILFYSLLKDTIVFLVARHDGGNENFPRCSFPVLPCCANRNIIEIRILNHGSIGSGARP